MASGVVLVADDYQRDLLIERAALQPVLIEVQHATWPIDPCIAERVVGLLVGDAQITFEIIECLPNLGVISKYGMSCDNIDLFAARKLGIAVSNTPDYWVEDVATHCLALLLDCCRGTCHYDKLVRAGHWNPREIGYLRRPSNMVVGIIGMGKVGRRLANSCQSLFKRITWHDPYVDRQLVPDCYESASLDRLFSISNAICVCIPLNDHTKGLISSTLIEKMPKGGFIVNVSRGDVIDEAALLSAIRDGHLAAAGLDVLKTEPPINDNGLICIDSVTMTPHAAFFSIDSDVEVREKACRNITRWLQLGSPEFIVQKGHRPKPSWLR
jgi:lactate dehydrogenase-like 2-hydroxyacid dehydrogenase